MCVKNHPMKKIYLVVLLLVACFVASAQRQLPFSYDFAGQQGAFNASGLRILNSDDGCLNSIFYGEQQGAMWFVSMDSCGMEYRQYLISPRLLNTTDDSVQIRFRYTIPHGGEIAKEPYETFVLGYCTADEYSSVDEFVWLEDTVVCTTVESWQMFVKNVPANAQYLAVAYTSGEQYALLVDDILFRADSPDAVYSFTVNANDGGTVAVTTNGQTTYGVGTITVNEGDELSYTVTSDQGSYISYLDTNGYQYNFAPHTVPTTFTQTIFPVLRNYELNVVFGHFTYRIQIAETENGRVVPDGGNSHELVVPWDTTVGFRFIPDEGYHISSVRLTSSNSIVNYYDCPDTLTIPNIRCDYTLEVAFALNDYVVTLSAGEGGTISGESNVQAFTSPQFLVSANPGYLIDTIFVDGMPLDIPHYSSYLYTFYGITSDHTLSATFVRVPFIVHYTGSEHGTLTAQGGVSVGLDSIQVYYEDTVVFHFSVEEGYELSELRLNDVSLEVANPYLLTHVAQNSLFHATFAEKTFHVTASTYGSGAVSPLQSGTIGYFDTVQFVVTPGYCMQTDSILLDGFPMDMSDTVRLTHLEGSHTLVAYFSQKYYTMELLPCAHGSIAGSSEVVCGGTSRLQFVPDHCYRLARFLLDGAVRSDLLHNVNDTVWAYVHSVGADHTVSVEFERITYNVNVQADGHGTVTPGAVGAVPCDTTVAFVVVPDECHYVSSVTVNGENAESIIQRYPCADSGFGDTLRFELVQIEQNQLVAVSFSPFEYTLDLSAGEHGSLSAHGTLPLACGADKLVTITPDECYEIASVLVDGEEVAGQLQYSGNTASYAFANIHASHTLEVAFARKQYTMGVVAAPHGTVLPGGDSVVLCGDNMRYVIVPDECYQIDSVWLDGTFVNRQMAYYPNANRSIGDTAVLSVSGITENHVVEVSFKPILYTVRAVALGNGSVSWDFSGSKVECGADVTLTMTPDDCHQISEVWFHNNLVTNYATDGNGVGTLQIQNVREDVYISVIYNRIGYSLALAQPTQHGRIDYLPSDRQCGDTVRVSYHADDCYHLDSVMVGNEWMNVSELLPEGDGYVCVVRGLRSDLMLDAAFSIDSVRVVSTAGAPLSVTDTVLSCGQDLTVYSVQEDCMQLDSIRINTMLYTAEDIDGTLLSLVGDTLFIGFENLHDDKELAVFYSQIQYQISVATEGQGSVSVPSSFTVACGDSVAVAINPNDCQHFDSLTINGAFYPLDNDTLLVIQNVRSDLQMVFHFGTDMYEIVAQSNDLGECLGQSGMVPCGSNRIFSFRAGDCAMLDSVFLDGVYVDDLIDVHHLPALRLENITSDHIINAVFKKIPYQVEVVTDSFSFLSVPSVNVVNCGEAFTVKITPDPCHVISGLLLDSLSVISDLVMVEGVYLYRLEDVRQNHTLEVVFQERSVRVLTAHVEGLEVLSLEESGMRCGSDTTLRVVPFNDCYAIDSVYLNGERVSVQSSYSFQNVAEDLSLVVFTHRLEYSVKVFPRGHYELTEGDYAQTVSCGDTLRIAFTPEDGYYISALMVDGDSIDAADFYVFENIHDFHTLSVLTEIYQYEVIAETNEWGYADPDTIVASHGSDVRLKFFPRDCYDIAGLTVNGVDCFDSLQLHEGSAELVLHSLSSDKRIVADFRRIEYTCSVLNTEGGSAIPSSATILCGDTLNVTVAPDACYHIASLVVNGESIPLEQLLRIGNELHYRVGEVRGNYTIEAQFEKNKHRVIVENHGEGTVVTTDEVVYCGNGYSFFVAPAPCTHLQSVVLNGEDITAHLTYRDNANPWLSDTACFTVDNVMEDQIVEVEYERDGERSIDLTFMSGTSVLRHENLAVDCGSDISLSVALDCYVVDSVLLDGARTDAPEELHLADVIADHTVQVMLTLKQYQITSQSTGHGIITPAGLTEVSCGSNKTYSMVPDQGYYIVSLLVDGGEVEPASSYIFENIRQNHTIEAVFAQYSYLVNVEVDGNGAVTPGDTSVWYGDAVHFALLPDDCHSIDSVVVDGVNYGAVAEYDFASVTSPHTLHGYFSRTEYSVSVGNSENGTVTLGSAAALCGDEVAFSVAPSDCYHLDSVLVNGENRGAVYTDTIRNVRQNQVVDAYFSPITYQISVESMEHGVVNVSSLVAVCGESVTLTVLPDACYSVDSVLVNGENIGAVASYTLSDIRGDQSVMAYFSMNEYNVEVIAGPHGTVTNAGMNVVRCGESFAIDLAADDCYEIGLVFVDGDWANGQLQGNRLVLDNITGDHVITVSFEMIQYYQYTSRSIGGSISPAFISVNCGGEVTYAINPINCYRIDTVWINDMVLPQDSLVFNGYNATLTMRDIRQSNTVRVKFTGISYQFNVENNGDGIVYLEQNSVDCNGEATFYVLPSQCERISTALLNGIDITDQLVPHANVNPLMPDTSFYTVPQMDANQLLQINYHELQGNQVAITYIDGETDLYAADSLLACGGSIYLSFSYECYSVDSVLVNGENRGALTELVLHSNLQDQTVQVYCSQNRYMVVSEVTEGGEILMEGGAEALCGGTVACTLVPESCYSIDSVVVNGQNQGAILSYVFENIVENQHIKAYFSRDEYAIATRTEGNGQITMDGSSAVLCGDNRSFVIEPAECSSLDSVVVNGVNQGVVSTLVVENIIENKEITAYFSLNEYQFASSASVGGQILPSGITTVACGSQQTYTILPEDCYSIDSVIVNGINWGAVATCSVSSTDWSGNQTIQAFFSQKTYNVRIEEGEHGTIAPAGDTLVLCGENLALSITPDDCYDIDYVMVDNHNVGVLESYVLEDVASEHIVSAHFVLREYVLTPVASAGGTITPDVTTTVACGTDHTFYFAPNVGYSIGAIVVDGDTLAPSESYTFASVTSNHTVKPLFSRLHYEITATAGTGGNVSPASSVVEYAGRKTITITADDCYHIDSVFADDVYVGSYPTYTFNNVTEPHTVHATFAMDEFVITAEAGEHGTITPQGETAVTCGTDITYVIVPETGWHISSLLVDGEQTEVAETYTFANVRENHAIAVQFAIDEFAVTATAGDGGTVIPASTVAGYGEDVAIEIAAADCHHIDSVFVDGVYAGAVASYTFEHIAASHTVHATFVMDEFVITAEAGEHGTITPQGEAAVTCGIDVTYTIVPETGWHISTLLIDGEQTDATETYTFANVRENHTIAVQFAINEYTVTATAGGGGSVTPTAVTVDYDGIVTIEITAADCYHIDSVFVDGVYVGAVPSYTFEHVAASHTLHATFAMDEFVITAEAGEHGTITPQGETAVTCGTDITYVIAPETGWHISSLQVDGEQTEVAGTYTFANVRENHTIVAKFAINEYAVTATAGEGGTVSPASTVAGYGEDVAIEIAAADCHHIDSVFVDGAYAGAMTSYTFERIAANHTLHATFAMDEFVITAEAGEHGTITPQGETVVTCGDEVSYTIAPETGWHISSLLVDGEQTEVAETYTFDNIRENHTIAVQFAIDEFTVTATAGEGGTVTPANSVAGYGEDVTIEIAAADCRHIDSVFVDGVYAGAVASYTFEHIAASHTLHATFTMDEFVITAESGEHGTISHAGDTTVPCGESVTYTFVPETGWHTSVLLVDGSPVEVADSYTFEGVRTDHTIQVQFAVNAYMVTATAGDGGSVTPAERGADYDEAVTIAITASDCYHVDSVFADGVYVGAVTSYTFEHIADNHTLHATFATTEYTTVVLPAPQHGTITPTNMTTVNCGDSVWYTIVPDEGYHVTELIVDGVSTDVAETYLFADVHANHRITAQFAIDEFTVTAEAGDGGLVTPTDTVVTYGESVAVAITAADCYDIETVVVDGQDVGPVSSYVFNNVSASHTVSATFMLREFILIPSAGVGGSISPSEADIAQCGSDYSYSFVPDEGYHLTAIVVDGETLPAAESYTFENIRDNHTITALFSIDEFSVTATAGEGGLVTPTDTVVSYGESVTVEITAADCYDIETVLVDGQDVGPVSSYVFNNVSAPHTVSATFMLREFILIPSAGVGGSISPSEADIAQCGSDYSYSFVPDEGYHLTAIVVDGETLPAAESYTFENIRDNHTITALFAIDEFTVTAEAGEGGSVTPTDTVVTYGADVTVEITAADCYDIETVVVDGQDVGPVASYVFENVAAPHTVTATFMLREFILVPSAGAGGSITPSEADIVTCGSDYTYQIVPDEGYHITAIVVDGSPVEVAGSYTFENIRDNHTIMAQFAIDEFTVTATAGEGGSVTPTDTTVAYGETVTVAITAADCYDIETVVVDGQDVGPVASYVFENVAAPHTVTATFMLREFILVPSAGAGGSITPSEADIVTCGSDYTYQIVPDEGYHITAIVVDGSPVEVAGSYTFENIRDNHTIMAQFAIDEFTVTATAGEGGLVTPTDTTVAYGESVTVEITAADCYHIDSVVVNGVNVGAVSFYELSNITENQVVESFFSWNYYEISMSVRNEGETIFYDTIHHLPCGSDTALSIPLFDCYWIDSISVNGIVMENTDAVQVESIHEDMEVVFYLSRGQYFIVATKVGNGVVSPSDTVRVLCDSVVTFTFEPDEGWFVEDIILDGESLGTPAQNQYTFYNVTANHTLEVVFAPTEFIITSSIDPIDAGNITPYGQHTVNYGEDQTYNITPFPGYQVVDVEVDGVSQGAITTYTFHHVDANHTIVAHLMTVGVEEAVENKDVAVWPNPVENVCHVRIPDLNGIGTTEMQLYDVQGKLILHKWIETEEMEIDLSGKPSGMYLLRIVSDGNVIATRKVIRK